MYEDIGAELLDVPLILAGSVLDQVTCTAIAGNALTEQQRTYLVFCVYCVYSFCTHGTHGTLSTAQLQAPYI